MSSHADVQGGGSTTPLTVACFANIKSKDTSQLCPLISKWEGGAFGYEYHLRYSYYSSEDQFQFHVSDDGTIPAIVQVDAAAGVTLGQWYSVIGWFDPSDTTIHIEVNGVETSAAATGIFAGTGAFKIGSIAGFFGNQHIAEAMVWQRLLTRRERIDFWRGGLQRMRPL